MGYGGREKTCENSWVLAFCMVSGWGIQEVLCHGDVEDLPGSEQSNSFCAPA